MIAALYVDARGPYMDMHGVDPWTIDRDARLYDGPSSVVAHPPCADWSRLSGRAKLVEGRRECGPRAVEQVQAFGGVLEHPAWSKLWHECDLPRPGEFADDLGGWTIAVDQCAWGHRARKATWLYIVGVHRSNVRPVLGGGVPTRVITTSKRGERLLKMSSLEARVTLPAFAEFLVSIARSAS